MKPPIYAPSSVSSQRTLMFARRIGIAILSALLLGGVLRALENQRQAESLRQQTAASLMRSVITVRPRAADAARKLALPASLRGNAETPIYARSNGYLSAWHKTIGDTVKKGELLASIDVPELEQELAQAKAQRNQSKTRLDLANSTLKRWEIMQKSDSAPQQEYEEKRSNLLQAQADLQAAEANVKRLEQIEGFRRVVAPFSGVISRRNVEVGNLVSGSQELFALTQTDPLRLTVWIPQAYTDDVKPGQEVGIRFPESQGKNRNARIDHLAGALDPINRSRQADITLANADGKLLPGAYVEVTLNLQGKTKALVAPANVLVIDQAGPHVVIVDAENRIGFRPVKLGRDYGREVEVLEGISAEEVLVASPSDLLVEGEIVKTVEVKETPTPAKPVAKEKRAAGG